MDRCRAVPVVRQQSRAPEPVRKPSGRARTISVHRLNPRELGVPPSPQLADLLARPSVRAGADCAPVQRDVFFPVSGRFGAGPAEGENRARELRATEPVAVTAA